MFNGSDDMTVATMLPRVILFIYLAIFMVLQSFGSWKFDSGNKVKITQNKQMLARDTHTQ